MTTFITNQINAKASKAGKTYWEVETNQGKATCFDYPIVQELEKHIGKPISAYDLETNEKGFINIRPAKGAKTHPVIAQLQAAPIAQPAPQFEEARKAKDVSIYTSYAKDLFIKLTEHAGENAKAESVMKICVDLIKQAKTSFERSEVFEQANPKVVTTIQG